MLNDARREARFADGPSSSLPTRIALDRLEDARTAYERALELAHSETEQQFLEQRLRELHAWPFGMSHFAGRN